MLVADTKNYSSVNLSLIEISDLKDQIEFWVGWSKF